jgi:hypothetical protein
MPRLKLPARLEHLPSSQLIRRSVYNLMLRVYSVQTSGIHPTISPHPRDKVRVFSDR